MKCKNIATFRYTWPRKDEALICDEHVDKLVAVASAMGFHLQIVPLENLDSKFERTCDQNVKGDV